jgi:hypothetical protein
MAQPRGDPKIVRAGHQAERAAAQPITAPGPFQTARSGDAERRVRPRRFALHTCRFALPNGASARHCARHQREEPSGDEGRHHQGAAMKIAIIKERR